MAHLSQRLEGAGLPPCLQSLPEPPAQLFLHGLLPRGPRVAIVGTRQPTPAARRYAGFLAQWFAERGVTIVSGGAKGIDAAAHRGALLGAGATLVVAPSSFDRPFPPKHRALFDDIVARGGGHLSCFESGVEPRRHQFFERNGLMVALSQALVVVEAPLRSGARNAAKWARRLARPCFVVPAPPWNERGRGCIVELQLGARALGAPDEVLRVLQEESPASVEPVPERRSEPVRRAAPQSLVAPDDRSTSAAVLRAIEAGASYTGDIAAAIGESLPEVNHALLLLTLSGHIDQGPGGVITITRR